MNCLCMRNQFVRDHYAETRGEQYPMPMHHPDCDAYKTEAFSRVEYDGSWFICRPEEVDDFLAAECSDLDQYTVTTVLLTQDQFENLPEFEGF